MADEYIDILDSSGNFTGDVKLKSEAHELGLYHASVHIWLYTLNSELLFQKRASIKDTFPSLWDVSVAGHIATGEQIELAAKREIQEEIGIDIPVKELDFIGTYFESKAPTPQIIDNEFHHVYLSQLHVPLDTFTLQKEEVSEVKLVHLNELEEVMNDSLLDHEYVPHDKDYLHWVLKEIKNRII